jgi:hypothetical protein
MLRGKRLAELRWITAAEMTHSQSEMWNNEVSPYFVQCGMPPRILDGRFAFVECQAVLQLFEYTDHNSLWIQTLFVRPMDRRTGLATRLIHEACVESIRKSLCVGFGTGVSNIPMRSLAEKRGFIAGQAYNEGRSIAYWRMPGLFGVE